MRLFSQTPPTPLAICLSVQVAPRASSRFLPPSLHSICVPPILATYIGTYWDVCTGMERNQSQRTRAACAYTLMDTTERSGGPGVGTVSTPSRGLQEEARPVERQEGQTRLKTLLLRRWCKGRGRRSPLTESPTGLPSSSARHLGEQVARKTGKVSIRTKPLTEVEKRRLVHVAGADKPRRKEEGWEDERRHRGGRQTGRQVSVKKVQK